MPDHAASCWASLQAIRARGPLIHNLTNFVAMETSANVLLALGASPAMVHAEPEAAEFAAIADALVINIGTLSPTWLLAMRQSAEAASRYGKPWVLDPVGAGATPYRLRAAQQLMELGPTVIRANASEVLTLGGVLGMSGRGVDSRHSVEDAAATAADLAARSGCVVAVTGAVDVVTDGSRFLRVRNGDPRMTRVTALGCAASATVAAFLVVESDAVAAAAQALAVFGLAGERAAARTRGPGSLKVELLNELALEDEMHVRSGVQIEG